MTQKAFAKPLACIMPGIATVAYVETFRLPQFFPYSDAVIAGGLCFGLSLSLLMLLPDRLLHKEEALIRHRFQNQHGLTPEQAESALQAISKLNEKVSRIKKVEKYLSKELQKQVKKARTAFHDIATLITHEPAKMACFRAIIIRSETVVEAIEHQSSLRKSNASQDQFVAGRERVQQAIESFMAALDAIEERWVDDLLTRIEVASDTANILLSRHAKGNGSQHA